MYTRAYVHTHPCINMRIPIHVQKLLTAETAGGSRHEANLQLKRTTKEE